MQGTNSRYCYDNDVMCVCVCVCVVVPMRTCASVGLAAVEPSIAPAASGVVAPKADESDSCADHATDDMDTYTACTTHMHLHKDCMYLTFLLRSLFTLQNTGHIAMHTCWATSRCSRHAVLLSAEIRNA